MSIPVEIAGKMRFPCFNCDRAPYGPDPEGFLVELVKVTKSRRFVIQAWYCSKDCMLEGMRYAKWEVLEEKNR